MANRLALLVIVFAAGCGTVKRGVCAAGKSECDESCVDLKTDEQNCGACGTVCAITERCVAGQCAITCPAGQMLCNAVCSNVTTDVLNCGGCGQKCPAGAGCVNGACDMTCSMGCLAGQVCMGGMCVCSGGATLCGTNCVDTQASDQHCGGCGKPCLVGQTCVGGTCKVSCSASLHNRIVDPWGLEWDGLERAPQNLMNATQACSDIEGRLPTATELYRVSAVQTAAVGQTVNINYLWAQNPRDPANQVILRLSDASVTTSATDVGTTRNFRCVCPQPARKEFLGNSCYGPPGGECFTLSTEGKRMNIDMQDRAPVPKAAAMWECAQVHAHVAQYLSLAEAIQSSLPNGSTNWLHTGDDANYANSTGIKWQNTQPIWQVNGNTNTIAMTTHFPFRCAGTNYDAGRHPNTVTGEFIPNTSYYKGELNDSALADWPTAHDTCYSRGGHLARSTELGELIMQGMPNGSNVLLWSSDQGSYNGNQFLGITVQWSGVAKLFKYYYNGAAEGTNWAYKTDPMHAYRCIYYPIDTQYMGPAASDCNGGCFKLTLPGATPASMWLDSMDRPAALLESAINTCRGKGGHLASERDLMEAIRKGLPNGSGNYVATWDIGYGDGTGAGTRYMIVKWSGTDTNFNDQYNTYMTNADLTNATIASRCMWSNELR
jgi:hypothetical protein